MYLQTFYNTIPDPYKLACHHWPPMSITEVPEDWFKFGYWKTHNSDPEPNVWSRNSLLTPTTSKSWRKFQKHACPASNMLLDDFSWCLGHQNIPNPSKSCKFWRPQGFIFFLPSGYPKKTLGWAISGCPNISAECERSGSVRVVWPRAYFSWQRSSRRFEHVWTKWFDSSAISIYK